MKKDPVRWTKGEWDKLAHRAAEIMKARNVTLTTAVRLAQYDLNFPPDRRRPNLHGTQPVERIRHQVYAMLFIGTPETDGTPTEPTPIKRDTLINVNLQFIEALLQPVRLELRKQLQSFVSDFQSKVKDMLDEEVSKITEEVESVAEDKEHVEEKVFTPNHKFRVIVLGIWNGLANQIDTGLYPNLDIHFCRENREVDRLSSGQDCVLLHATKFSAHLSKKLKNRSSMDVRTIQGGISQLKNNLESLDKVHSHE